MKEPLDHLLVDYLDDPTTARIDALDEALASDPALAERLIADGRMHRLLRSELAPIALTPQVLDAIRFQERSFTAQVMSGLRLQPRHQRRTQRALGWFPSALAAGLLAAVLVTVLNDQGSAANVILTSGPTLLLDGARTRTVPAGSPIPMGMVVAGADGEVASGLVWPDGSRIHLPSASRVRCDSAPAGQRVHLVSGQLDADIAAQQPHRPFRIFTNDCTVTVVGTGFTVRTGDRTFVAVRSGVVQVTAARGGEPVTVAAGEWVTSEANGALRWSRPPRWRLADAWPDLNLIGSVHRSRSGVRSITSVPYRPDVPNPHFTPQQQICLQANGGGTPVFILPRSFWLQVRLRASTAGTAMLTLDARNGPDATVGNLGSRTITVDQHWRDYVFYVSDFHRDTDGSILAAGDWAVQTLCVWGMGPGTIDLEAITLGAYSEP